MILRTAADYEAMRREYARKAYRVHILVVSLYGAALGLALVALWRWSAP